MGLDSKLTNQFVNSTIIAMFLVGGWLLSVYATADSTIFGESEDDEWILTGQDNDNNNDISEGDTATLQTGSLFDEELQRHMALLKIKAFAGYIFIFSAAMIVQRFAPIKDE